MNEREIFSAAVQQQDLAERAAYLEQACAGDGPLRQRVEVLLHAHEMAGSFLEKPVLAQGDTADEQPGSSVKGDSAVESPSQAVALQRITEGPGTLIGPYKLLQQIGEGGMGVVYMAEQEQPVRRKVALKIIKPGMDSAHVIARFEAERQALALMDHTNIAKVLDAGATDTGRPFFVMELVKGVPITRFCDGNNLSVRERLELFVPVCQAIQHAHQKGIIHRDVKPSNVLVTLYDGRPVPKVIDFGIAKATEQRLTERTLFTQYGEIIGTFEYMSPEQAEMSGLDIDTRSDVYSLGVLLYELLTGSTPLIHKRLREVAYTELLRLIREEEAEKPSTRLSHSGEALASIALQRKTEPEKLSKLVRGELDWIVLKALEKDRMRRYESASAFAADVQHYLNDEAVQACPPSAGYRLRKFARRNKRVLATVTLLGVMLLVAVGAVAASALWAAVQAKARLQVEVATSKELERNLYFTHIALAEREQAVANWGRAEELLDACPEHLRDWEWYYLKRLRHAPPLTLAVGERQIGGTGFGLDFSRDGRLLAAPCGGPTVKVWDLATGEEVLVVSGHTKRVIRVAFSPDGRRLASASEDQTVKIWDITTGAREVNSPRFNLEGHQATVRGLAFSPDGRRLASAGGDSRGDKWVMLWDTTTGERLFKFPGEYTRFTFLNIAFSPDGRRLAAGSEDNSVKIWDVETGRELFTLRGHTESVFSVFFSPDGRRLASLGWDGSSVKVWDLPPGEPGVSAPEGRVLTSQFSRGRHSNGAWSVAFSPDGQRLAIASGVADGNVRVYDVTTGDLLYTLAGHIDRVVSVAFSPNGQRLASTCIDKTVKLWETATGKEVLTLRGHTEHPIHALFSPGGERLVSLGVDGTLKVWDAMPALANSQRHTLELSGHAGIVYGVAFSPDGRRLASASADRTVKVSDAVTGQELLTLHGHTDKVLSVAFSSDGRRLASGGLDWAVKLWDAVTGREVLTLSGFKGPVRSLAFSPDNKHLATCGTLQVVEVWDLPTDDSGVSAPGSRGLTRRFSLQHGDFVYMVAFSRDGRYLATASADTTAKIWDAATGKEVPPPVKGHTSVAFSADGRLLATGFDQKLKVWDWAAGQEVRPHCEHTHHVFSVAFSPDGRYLASASWAEVIIWDLQTDEKIRPRGGLAGAIRSLAFSPDGQRLAVASGYKGKGEITVWDAALWKNKARGER
jgi:WD40 repeat protein/serine/threonine protein kinase